MPMGLIRRRVWSCPAARCSEPPIPGGAGGAGTVFTINTNGTGFNVLWNFSAGDTNADGIWTNADGGNPEAGLVLAGTNLFGTTYYGGSNGNGTVFSLGTNGGGFTVLKTFSAADPDTGTNTDGANPYAGLDFVRRHAFRSRRRRRHGRQWNGLRPGHQRRRVQCAVEFFGDRSKDTFTNTDGAYPDASLVLSGNTLFGTTSAGGFWAGGTIFEISANGSGFENLHNFDFSTDGDNPYASLILSGNLLFGTTSDGGRLWRRHGI